MANTITRRGAVLNLVLTSDWAWTTTFTGAGDVSGLPVHSITFKPGAANDRLVIKAATDSGPTILNEICLDTASRTIYFKGLRLPLFVDFSDCTLSAGHRVIIILGGERR